MMRRHAPCRKIRRELAGFQRDQGIEALDTTLRSPADFSK